MNVVNEAEAPKGPWDAPLREYVKTFPMEISVFDNDKLIHREDIDYGNYNHRKFLGRLTYWACSQGYTVETTKK